MVKVTNGADEECLARTWLPALFVKPPSPDTDEPIGVALVYLTDKNSERQCKGMCHDGDDDRVLW